ncbi:MAG: PQQ-dependent sugar dehydrogenase [Deltaproteobacteria bacterium]|nr:PQQ-dependent sugar dehydrogenase [Deltaproteobacteria bacterium]
MKTLALLLLCLGIAQAHNFPMGDPTPLPVKFEPAFGLITFHAPLFLTTAPREPSQFFVLEQGGKIKRVPAGKQQSFTFLDLTGAVSQGGSEEGLLGLAFDPQYAQNRYFYVDYTAPNPLRTIIARFKATPDGSAGIPTSKTVLLEFSQPYTNHNGGMIAFGPDAMLYVGTGDGGSGGDPHNNGQNKMALLGKILRLDVRTAPYKVPPDNPFVGDPNARPEIWAMGLRNPWRFSFDRETGEMWVGDVGQSRFEEIDIVKKGGNYGWRPCEGSHLYPGGGSCPSTYVAPVYEYPRSVGACVTGGYVYRGTKLPNLRGAYIYGDYVTKKIWAITLNNGIATNTWIADLPSELSAFGEGPDGELFALGHTNGKIYRIVPASGEAVVHFPTLLSETGLFKTLHPLVPEEDLHPYDVKNPLWSDGAEKARWLSLPVHTKITFDIEKPWRFPIGAALVKHFALESPLETRVLLNGNGGWKGYTYRWRSDLLDADLLFHEEEGDNWYYPSRTDCLRCHTTAAGSILGVSTKTLTKQTLNSWIDLVEPAMGDIEHLPTLPQVDDTTLPLESRARAYLAVQCSMCHQPNTPVPHNLDMRFTTPATQMNLFGVPPQGGDLGVTGAMRIKRGDKEHSILWLRMNRRDDVAMPPLATHKVDPLGVKLIGDWIDSL